MINCYGCCSKAVFGALSQNLYAAATAAAAFAALPRFDRC